jgi:hypothetical protein
MGRFMTADWAIVPVAVPYAVLGNPQTLNLYSYVENNPATGTDPDGHAGSPYIGDALGNYNCQSGGNKDCDKAKQDEDKSQEAKQAQGSGAQTAAATVAAAPTTAPTSEAVDAVVKPLVDSAEGALDAAGGSLLGAFGIVLLSPEKTGGQGDVHSANDKVCCTADGQVLTPEAAHKSGARESTREKHETGEARKSKDRGGEKGDARRRPPRKPPNGWKGPWPPKPGTDWW